MRHSMAWPDSCTSLLAEIGSSMPAATRICHLTRSTPGDHFGYRMLHLQAGVHLHEVELPVRPKQEFDGAHGRDSRRLWRLWWRPRSSCARVSSEIAGEGLSSMSFWCLRCMEHSRSPRQTTSAVRYRRAAASRRAWHWRKELFHDRLRRRQKRSRASAVAARKARSRSSWAFSTLRMPRPPPPRARLNRAGGSRCASPSASALHVPRRG